MATAIKNSKEFQIFLQFFPINEREKKRLLLSVYRRVTSYEMHVDQHTISSFHSNLAFNFFVYFYLPRIPNSIPQKRIFNVLSRFIFIREKNFRFFMRMTGMTHTP